MTPKIFSLLSFFLVASLSVLSQQRLANKYDQLSIICKTWGLVKYYHPNVQTGEFDLDEGLINIITQFDTNSSTNVNDLLREWIISLGPIDDYKLSDIKSDAHFQKNYSIAWLRNTTIIESDLTDILLPLTSISTSNKKYYVRKNSRIGNIEILNEKKYGLKDTGNKYIRLLIFFKYWNIIEYFYPYKYLIDKNWDDILKEYIPIFIDAKTQLDFQLAFLSLTVELNDSHGNFFTPDVLQFFGTKYLPVYFKIVQDQAIITGYYNDDFAKKSNLMKGDVIISSDSVSVNKRIEQLDRYIPGSNRARKEHNYRYSLFNGSEDSTNITLVRSNDTISQKVKRFSYKEFDIKPNTLPKWEFLNDDILFIRVWKISGKDIRELIKLLKKTKDLILDLRYYPKFNVQNRIVEIIKKKDSEYYKKIVPDLSYPGKYIFRDNVLSGPKGSYQFDGNVIVLVDNRTISYGEFIVMDLQSCENVTVIGSKTAGAVGLMSTFEVIDGIPTSFTGTGIFYPDSSDVQRSGVKIDHEVELSIEGIRNGEDEILNRALEFLSND